MKITFINGVRSGEELEFSVPEISIGRETDNLLELPVDGVSRHHAKLVRDAAKNWSIVDLGSTNGVKVNGSQIHSEQQLQEGDIIAFGEEMMRISGLTDGGNKIVFSELSAEAEPPITPAPAISPAAAAAPTVLLENILSEQPAEKEEEKKAESGEAPRDFFSRKKKELSGSSAEPPRKKLLNVIFYFAIALIVISALYLFNRTQTVVPEETVEEKLKPFALHYVKEIVSKDNIFRFEMTVENRSVWFVIDDVRSDRKYESQKQALSDASFSSLRSVIQESGVMKMIQPERGGISDAGSTRLYLQVIDGGESKEVEIFNTSPPRSFLTAENELTSVASEYGLQSISLTPEELLAQAEQSYTRGRDLFENWQSRQANLRESIRYLTFAVDCLEQFTPKPKTWKNAQALLVQAKNVRAAEMKRLNAEYLRARQMKDYPKQRETLLKIRDTCEENSENFRKANEKLMQVDAILRKGGRRK